MKVGDLVVFYSSFEPFERDYKCRNPGVILSIVEKTGVFSGCSSSEVLWCNQEVTTEHSTYLQLVGETKHV